MKWVYPLLSVYKDHDADFTSAELKLEEKTEKNSTTDSSITTYTFVNAAEETTFAIDRGYAVRKVIRNAEGKALEERYFETLSARPQVLNCKRKMNKI